MRPAGLALYAALIALMVSGSPDEPLTKGTIGSMLISAAIVYTMGEALFPKQRQRI